MNAFVVGIGASGFDAEVRVIDALRALRNTAFIDVRAQSRSFQNPAVGGATLAPFVNAAVVVETALAATPLLRTLHALEARAGRMRFIKNGPRTLDLDLLWQLDAPAPSSEPLLPHPRLLSRPFAVIPAIEALEQAGRAVPFALRAAARSLDRGCLQPTRSR